MKTATMTSKGQITIPKEIRQLLCLDTGDRVHFLLDKDGEVRICPANRDISSLKGIVPKPAKPVSIDDMKKTIRNRGRRH